ncbi:MAG: metallophosphoesterase [Methylibium sp.]|uniref:metallophosphoesterase family protein n=1 Tax=Methylibium sp. TaxID=2067992 RepID=UPI00183B032C|nr:metallophosphoesterase family protein [Methylibium sp.]MBA3598832.1 metallophosphoesterase [Methylibium sp.]
MSVLLQISDTHFGTEQAPVVEALVRLAHAQAPDVVVLSGDITQRARASQFRDARAFVDRLRAPALLVIPGNHDIALFNLAARLFAPYANHRRAFGYELEPQFESPDLLVLALNTTRFWRHTDGEVSAKQIERVARRLGAAHAAQLRIVVVHQPVAVTQACDEENLLHGREAAVRRWAEAGCDLILGGHIHLPFVLPLSERYALLPREMWAVQAGTAVSARVRGDAPNSVNLIRHGTTRRRCRIERWDYSAGRQAFECVHGLEVGAACEPGGR